jgi:hypothetical protein
MIDFLPNEMAPYLSDRMDAGVEAIRKTLGG